MSDYENEPKSGFLRKGKGRQLTDSSDDEPLQMQTKHAFHHARTLDEGESAELVKQVFAEQSEGPQKQGILRKRKQSSNPSFDDGEFFNERRDDSSFSEL